MSRTWTKEHRERQKAFDRRRYPTDLTDEEWERISLLSDGFHKTLCPRRA